MPSLKILYPNGDIDRYPLSKLAPVSIGSHSSNDISLNEAGVEVLHCRIAWAKSGYEALAAGAQGIEVNGGQVQRAMLKAGDVLRFGKVDVLYRDKDVVPAGTAKRDEPPAATKRAKNPPAKERPAEPPSRKRPRSEEPSDRAAADLIASRLRDDLAAEFDHFVEQKAPAAEDKPAKPARPPAKEKEKEREKKFNPPTEEVVLAPVTPPPPSRRALPPVEPRVVPPVEPEAERRPAPAVPPAEPEEERPSWEERRRQKGAAVPAPSPVAAPDEPEELDEPEEVDEEETPPPERRPAVSPRREPSPVAASPAPVSDRLKKALQSRSSRPSEQDPLRSPLVIGLGAGIFVLAIVGGVFYLMAGRQSSDAEFQAAETLYRDGKLNSAIAALDSFAVLHPEHPSAGAARVLAGLARVDAKIETATPDYPAGVEQLKAFITAQREAPGFADQYPAITQRAGKMALGAAEDAGKAFNRGLMAVSEEARTLLLTYSPKETPPAELLKQIEARARGSDQQNLRHETFVAAVQEINDALAKQTPMQALVLRRNLLARYPEFAEDRKVTGLMAATLEAEKKTARAEALDVAAMKDEVRSDLPDPATSIFSARSRSDQVSVGEAAFVQSKDCLYGIDTVTGAPVWRRPVGLGHPFFPIADPATQSLVLFDPQRRELQRIQQNSGKPLWRQTLEEPVRGHPLLAGNALYVPTEGRHLYRIEFETGRIAARATFSQDVTGPAAWRDGERLLVVGNREVAYTLGSQSLECQAVSYLGHGGGSVEAPLLTMGRYLLAVENVGEGAVLRVLNPAADFSVVDTAATPEDRTARTIAGRVLDTPVLRGRDLFVPSSGERVSAFAISDDAGEPPVTVGPVYQTQSPRKSPVFLTAGSDRQVWMAGSTLRKLQLVGGALGADERTTGAGLASQPLQTAGSTLFNARRRAWTDAVTLTQTDRDELTSEWQAVAGARLLAWSAGPGDGGDLIAVSEAGATFRATPAQLATSGFSLSSPARLNLPDDLTAPLLATSLPDGQLVAVSGDPNPRAWVINRLGQIERQVPLERAASGRPVALGNRIVVPMPGRLHLLRSAAGESAQDFLLPQGDERPPAWQSVTPLDDQSLVAVLSTGQMLLVRLQTTPRLHLAEAARVDLGGVPSGAPGVGDGTIAVGFANGTLKMFSSELAPRGERTFEQPIENDVWIAGGMIFVEERGKTLHAVRPEGNLASRWSVPLEGQSVAGAPQVEGAVAHIALRNGTVLTANAETGAIESMRRSRSLLASGPFRIGQELYVATLDGSFQRVPQEARP